MNKFIIMASLLVIPATSMAASQPAVSQKGTCHVFKSETMVPNGWKNVDGCEAYQKENDGQRLDAVNARRNSDSNWEKKYKKESIEVKNTLRKGSGKLTRGGADREAAGIIEKKESRATTTRALGTSKSYLLRDERRLDTTTKETSSRTGTVSGTATKMKRSGDLSTSFWSTEAERRDSRLETQSISSKLKKALYARQSIAKQGRVEKKSYKYTGPTLQKTYRGERIEGVLSN